MINWTLLYLNLAHPLNVTGLNWSCKILGEGKKKNWNY